MSPDHYKQTDEELAAEKFFKISTSTLHDLVRGLLVMLTDGYGPEDYEFGDLQLGICWNLKAVTGRLDDDYSHDDYNASYTLLEHAAASWDHPRYSGSSVFPIPHNGHQPMWRGEQLEMRRDLMRHALGVANLEIARRASSYHPPQRTPPEE